jgi:hypothetical protein
MMCLDVPPIKFKPGFWSYVSRRCTRWTGLQLVSHIDDINWAGTHFSDHPILQNKFTVDKEGRVPF